MALNIAKCVEAQKNLETRGNDLFLNQRDLQEDTMIRILPPVPEMDGLFYFPVGSWWLNKKNIITGDTFGGPDYVEDEFRVILADEQAKEPTKQDGEVIKMCMAAIGSISGKKFGVPLHKDLTHWLPALVLVHKGNDLRVENDKTRVLKLYSPLTAQLTKIITHRMYQNGTENGALDRVLGANFSLSKTGSGKETKYGAMNMQVWEAPAQFYADIPNVYNIARDLMPNEAYQRACVREAIFGTPIPGSVEAAEKIRKEKAKEAFQNSQAAKQGTPAAGGATLSRPKPNVSAAGVAAASTNAVSFEEEEEEEAGDQFDAMDRNALKIFIRDNNLAVKVYKTTTDEDLRAAVREAAGQLEEE